MKVIRIFYCLITIALICIAAAVAFGAIPFEGAYYQESIIIQAAVAAIAVLLVIMGIIAMFESKKAARQNETQQIKDLTFGTISITVSAIEEIAKRYFDEIKEVRAVNLLTSKTSIGINLGVKLTFAPQIVIPEITEKIQTELKECLETFTGITVENVNVTVCDSTMVK